MHGNELFHQFAGDIKESSGEGKVAQFGTLGAWCEVCAPQGNSWWARGDLPAHQDGRVVKALDLRSNGHMPAWVRTPLLVGASFFSGSEYLILVFRASVQSRDGSSRPCVGGDEAIQHPKVRILVRLSHPLVQAEHGE